MRKIIIGKNSNLYKNYKNDFLSFFDFAISHNEIASFHFLPNDFIFVLSYPRSISGIKKMVILMKQLKNNKILLLSTCSAILNNITSCYYYPKIKFLQEKYFSKTFHNLIIFRVGTVIRKNDYDNYYGLCVINDKVFFRMIREFIKRNPKEQLVTRFDILDFKGSFFESHLYDIYCRLIFSLIPFPCILRPLDVILRLFNIRWYGYGALTKIMSEKKQIL